MKEFFLFFHSSVPTAIKDRILENIASSGFTELPYGKNLGLAFFVVVMDRSVNIIPNADFLESQRICIKGHSRNVRIPRDSIVFDENSLSRLSDEEHGGEEICIFLSRFVAELIQP